MIIRPFTEQDRRELIALWKECGLVAPQNDPNKDIDRKLQVDPELFLVGTVDDKIVATVMGGYEGHRGWINYLGVKKSYRKKGLAKELLKVLEQMLRERGCPKINLMVRTSNREVIRFYQSIGFIQDDIIGMGKRLVNDGGN